MALWTVSQRVGVEVKTPAEALHGKAGRIYPLYVSKVDATGRAYIAGFGLFDYAGGKINDRGEGVAGDRIFPWTAEHEARFQRQRQAEGHAPA